MAKMAKVTDAKPNALSLIPTTTRGKERKDSYEYFFDLHTGTYTVVCVCVHESLFS